MMTGALARELMSMNLKSMDWCFAHWSDVTDKLKRFCGKREASGWSNAPPCRIGYLNYFEHPPNEDKKEKEACCKCCCHESS